MKNQVIKPGTFSPNLLQQRESSTNKVKKGSPSHSKKRIIVKMPPGVKMKSQYHAEINARVFELRRQGLSTYDIADIISSEYNKKYRHTQVMRVLKKYAKYYKKEGK